MSKSWFNEAIKWQITSATQISVNYQKTISTVLGERVDVLNKRNPFYLYKGCPSDSYRYMVILNNGCIYFNWYWNFGDIEIKINDFNTSRIFSG